MKNSSWESRNSGVFSSYGVNKGMFNEESNDVVYNA